MYIKVYTDIRILYEMEYKSIFYKINSFFLYTKKNVLKC